MDLSSDSLTLNASIQSCKDCLQEFAITLWEKNFRLSLDLPDPLHCSHCRSRRRLLHLNQIHLTKRNCDATGKSIISHFSDKVNHPVYCPEYFHSDAFDARKFGQEFDFNKSFFDQLKELKSRVPHVSLHSDYARSENSAYTNFTSNLKSCYLVFNSNHDRDCLYSYGLDNSRSCVDCLRVQESELCYEAVDCLRCYNSAFIEQSENCSDSFFLRNCISCKNCLMCTNLLHKEYYFQNKPIEKKKYQELVEQFQSWAALQKYIQEFKEFKINFPERYYYGVQNENVSGNYLVNSKNALSCFDSHDLWDGMYATQAFAKMHNFLDCDECGGGELMIESANCGPEAYKLRCCFAASFGVQDLTYCMECVSGCSNLFGCISMKRNEYCILNKQYSKEEYLKLVPRIIDQMKLTGEWGQFFPPALSDFPYNLTQAQVHYPISEEQAKSLGFTWEKNDHSLHTEKINLPDKITEVEDDITEFTLPCHSCGRSCRFQKYELKWHRQSKIALPRNCFFCRHQTRQNKRTKRQIYNQTCDNCSVEISSAYPPNHTQAIYCEKCFAAIS